MRTLLAALAGVALLAWPASAPAQTRTEIGIGTGAVAGAVVGGPIGAVVGAAAGGVIAATTAPPRRVRARHAARSRVARRDHARARSR